LYALTFTAPDGTPRREVLPQGETLIGRAPSCDLVLPAAGVSRRHARIRVSAGACTLSDAGSSYGTYLNGSKLTTERLLKAGDTFICGQVAFTVEQRVDDTDLLSAEHRLVDEKAAVIRPIEGASATASSGSVLPIEGAVTRPERLLHLLGEIARTLATVHAFPQVLAQVVDLLFDVVPAERAFLLLRDSPDQAMTARVLRNRDGSAPERPTLSRTIVNYVLRERVAMLAADAAYDPRLHAVDSVHDLEIRSFMCAPLWNRSEVIGVLYADTARARAFGEDDLEVFTALANYAAVAVEHARVSEQLLQETRRRERLERYHSPGVVNRILSDRMTADGHFATRERDVTVMFCDLVAFTSLCERMSPSEVAELLNSFFARMAEHIFEVDGTLDKFVGDAILGVFGAPFAQDDHADRAVRAALGMRRTLADMNKERSGAPLQVRIALNSGRAVSGDIGSPRRREFTVLGDVVNTAARIQASVCQPDQIVISGNTLMRLTTRIPSKPLGPIALRGRAAPIELFEI
jgi:adenylate cyclase